MAAQTASTISATHSPARFSPPTIAACSPSIRYLSGSTFAMSPITSGATFSS